MFMFSALPDVNSSSSDQWSIVRSPATPEMVLASAGYYRNPRHVTHSAVPTSDWSGKPQQGFSLVDTRQPNLRSQGKSLHPGCIYIREGSDSFIIYFSLNLKHDGELQSKNCEREEGEKESWTIQVQMRDQVIASHEFLLPPPSNLVLYKQTDQYPVNIQHQQGFVFTSLLKIYAITAFLNYPRIYNKILVSSQGYFMLSVNHLIFPYQIITIASI